MDLQTIGIVVSTMKHGAALRSYNLIGHQNTGISRQPNKTQVMSCNLVFTLLVTYYIQLHKHAMVERYQSLFNLVVLSAPLGAHFLLILVTSSITGGADHFKHEVINLTRHSSVPLFPPLSLASEKSQRSGGYNDTLSLMN